MHRQVDRTRTGGLWRCLGRGWCWVGSRTDVAGSASGWDSDEDEEEDSEDEEGVLVRDAEGRVTTWYGPFKIPYERSLASSDSSEEENSEEEEALLVLAGDSGLVEEEESENSGKDVGGFNAEEESEEADGDSGGGA